MGLRELCPLNNVILPLSNVYERYRQTDKQCRSSDLGPHFLPDLSIRKLRIIMVMIMVTMNLACFFFLVFFFPISLVVMILNAIKTSILLKTFKFSDFSFFQHVTPACLWDFPQSVPCQALALRGY